MAQTLKDEVRSRIEDAALEAFSRNGFEAASMADIARRAGVSTGNLYRYYDGKETLFRAVVRDEHARALTRKLGQRVRALRGVRDLRALDPGADYHVLSEEILAWCIAHRREVVVLLGRAAGTPHASFADETVARLARLARAHARSIGAPLPATDTTRFVLDHVYQSFVRGLVEILARHADPDDVRDAVRELSAYHLAGLSGLFESVRSIPKRSTRGERKTP